MITIFNRSLLAVVSSIEERGRIRDFLVDSDIKFYTKTIYLHKSAPANLFGSSYNGQIETRTGFQFFIYVHKRDYQKATELLSKLSESVYSF